MNELLFSADPDGAVDLYYNQSRKILETTENGVRIFWPGGFKDYKKPVKGDIDRRKEKEEEKKEEFLKEEEFKV